MHHGNSKNKSSISSACVINRLLIRILLWMWTSSKKQQVSQLSSQVLSILWTSEVEHSNLSLSMLFECGHLPPTCSLRPPDVIHVVSVPRPSSFYTTLCLFHWHALYWTQTEEQKNMRALEIWLRWTVKRQAQLLVFETRTRDPGTSTAMSNSMLLK